MNHFNIKLISKKKSASSALTFISIRTKHNFHTLILDPDQIEIDKAFIKSITPTLASRSFFSPTSLEELTADELC